MLQGVDQFFLQWNALQKQKTKNQQTRKTKNIKKQNKTKANPGRLRQEDHKFDATLRDPVSR